MTVTTNAAAVAADMRRAGADVHRAVERTTRRYGLLLQTRVRANMSGRSGIMYYPDTTSMIDLSGTISPDVAGVGGEIGPRFQQGDLRRSVSPFHGIGPNTISSSVGSNMPQASRLEHGFVGVDAIGRSYEQPPYPAWRPALADLDAPYRAAIGQATAKAMRG